VESTKEKGRYAVAVEDIAPGKTSLCGLFMSLYFLSTLEGVLFQNMTTLQRHNTENSKHIFPEKELRGLSPNFHIRVSVSASYIPRIGPHIFLQQKADRCANWDCGRALPFLGIHTVYVFSLKCSRGDTTFYTM
jgi:hypothetical protein